MVKDGIAAEVLTSQIQQSRVVYRPNIRAIIDLKKSGVSIKVLDSLMNMASRQEQVARFRRASGCRQKKHQPQLFSQHCWWTGVFLPS